MGEPRDRHESLELIALPLTGCNATCDYCFVRPGGATMSLAEVTVLLERLREYANSRPSLRRIGIHWQGGEVFLLGSSWWRKVGEISREILCDIDVTVEHSLQTNLLPYDSSWAPVVHELFGGSIGSSLDFPSRHRRTEDLDPEAFERVWHDRFVRARNDGVRVGVIALVTPDTVRAGARQFHDHMFGKLELEHVQLNLPFPAMLGTCEGRSPIIQGRINEMASFLQELLEIWISEGRAKGHVLRPFSALLERFSGRAEVALPCIFAANCAENFCAVGPNGQAALCDCWVTTYPSFHMGNIHLDPIAGLMRDNAVRDRYYERTEFLLRADECGSCRHVAICFGGCPVRTYSTLGVLNARDPYCEVYQAMFDAVEASG